MLFHHLTKIRLLLDTCLKIRRMILVNQKLRCQRRLSLQTHVSVKTKIW